MKFKLNKSTQNLLWTIAWTFIYSIFYLVFPFLLNEIFKNSNFIKTQFLYLLVLAFCFSLAARIVWSFIHKDRIELGSDVFFFWTFAFAFSLWFSQFLRDLAVERTNSIFLTNSFVSALIIGLIICLLIKLIKRIDFRFGKVKIQTQSKVFTGIILIVAGILTFRFSYDIFVGWFNWFEGLGWSWLVGSGLIFAGLLVIVAWWRNNVATSNVHFHGFFR